jgi:hypothetical protein
MNSSATKALPNGTLTTLLSLKGPWEMVCNSHSLMDRMFEAFLKGESCCNDDVYRDFLVYLSDC